MYREGRRDEDPQYWLALGKQDWLESKWYGDTRQTSWGGGVISLKITISRVIFDNLFFSFLFFFSIFNMCRRDSLRCRKTHGPNWSSPGRSFSYAICWLLIKPLLCVVFFFCKTAYHLLVEFTFLYFTDICFISGKVGHLRQ